jgi:general secretion pathway protein E
MTVVAVRASNPALLRTLIARHYPNPANTFVRNAFIERDAYSKLTGSADTPAGFFRSLVAHAISNGASDIHLRPLPDGSSQVYMRVDGMLRDYKNVTQKQVASLIRHVEIMASIDFMSKTASKEGRLAIEHDGRQVDLRVSVIPGPSGESVVLRILDPLRFPASLDSLALPRPQLRALSGILMRPHGLLVAVGPTGSGKTTTLYTLLRELLARNLHIVTAEDPVEYRLHGINQFESRDFAGLLPQLLRHDPDVVMVGELRDEKTVAMAVNAALTGHLVLSTVHANDSASTIHRLLGLGAPMHVLTSSLAGILGQRLVRLTCNSCGGAGCEECGRTGYLGRTLVAELAKPRVSMAHLSGVPSHAEVQSHLDFLGGVTLNESILKLARRGETSWQEAAGLVTDPSLLPADLREALGYGDGDPSEIEVSSSS